MTVSRLRLACPPRFATARNPDRPTLGPRVGEVARLLGTPLMPWQQYVADVALEVDPATGRLWYFEGRMTVPRRQGKTRLVLAKAVHRCSATGFFGPRQRIVYTAQTRKDARKRFREDYEPDLLAARQLRVRPSWAPGDEHMRFPNGSRFGIESTTEKAGHGDTLDEAYVDECFAFPDNRVEQSFGPPMLTRENTQIWPISTAGWLDASPYLWEKVEHGRRVVASGEPSRICYFEWSAPQDADPFDRAVWRSCMPALGFTIDEDAIAAELERMTTSPEGLNGFRRAYLNQWVPKHATANVVSAEAWESCADPDSRIVGVPVLAASMTPDRSTVSLVAAGRRADGLMHVEVVLHGSAGGRFGGSGLPFAEETVAVARRNKALLVLHPGHAVGSLLGDFTNAGVRVHTVTAGEYTRSCGAFYDAVSAVQVRYPPPQPELDRALSRASRKPSGEAWRWVGDGITSLVAASQALHAALTLTGRGSGRVVALT